jgi:hypothetical protein
MCFERCPLLIRDYSIGNEEIVYEVSSLPNQENAGMAQSGECSSRLNTGSLVSSLNMALILNTLYYDILIF